MPVDNLLRQAEEDNKLFISRFLALPKPSSAGPTGTWRTYKPVVHSDKCRRCGLCWLYCPEEVIEWKPGAVPTIDYTFCKGCGVCAHECPVKAIELVYEGA